MKYFTNVTIIQEVIVSSKHISEVVFEIVVAVLIPKDSTKTVLEMASTLPHVRSRLQRFARMQNITSYH